MKLAVIGGGSTYTPELIDGIARLTGDIKVTEVALVDPDESRLSVVGPFSARIMRSYGHPAVVRWTSDTDDGLDGAGAVLLQLRVGYQTARNRDETWPLECGCVGQETVGAGGLAKALRTVPVVLDIAERARQRAAADAWIMPSLSDTRNSLSSRMRPPCGCAAAVDLTDRSVDFRRRRDNAVNASSKRR